ncbi:MAG: CheR family methyltransferase [Thiogranum sp.]|nr:CheR family methyltransferase [Thiogranum sp.]
MSKPESNRPCLIVGIGASAGGLEAFKTFFTKMPADSGIGFVLLPHLDPGHASMMTELLSKQTSMPVVEARDGQSVEPDNIYILPPAKRLSISDGRLQLTEAEEARSQWTAIDQFLRALADDQRERAAGIILSGTGSHGTLGLKEIRQAGGIGLAQDPDTAGYSQMPWNAIASGLVDLVLAPDEMPGALVDYVKRLFNRPQSEQDGESEDFNRIIALLRTRTKYDFRSYRRSMLLRRIRRRMSLVHADTPAEYYQLLSDKPEEPVALYKDLLIGVTAFFREPEAFEVLRQRVIPELVARSNEDVPVRVWVPACSTGEEAYTLAMLLIEGFDQASKLPNLQLFATDIDEDSLDRARQGIYPENIAVDVSAESLRRFFVRNGSNHFQVSKQLRESVVFAMQNLITDAPFSRLDLISCRNLLIYLEPDLQSEVIQLFHFSLKENGYLMLGPSESIGRKTDFFTPVSKQWRVFQRIGHTRRHMTHFPISGPSPSRSAEGPVRQAEHRARSGSHFAELTQKHLLADYAPASVLINRDFEILHFSGPMVEYLELPSGEPTRNLISMCRDGLRTRIRTAVPHALQEKRTVVDSSVRLKRHGRYIPVTLTVRPVNNGAGQLLALVSFEEGDTSSAVSAQQLARSAEPEKSDDGMAVEQLEQELDATREDLQSTIEELESSNEELKVANEEVMSMNEELQSTNEEMETSKEELQSMNEELNTVNTQLQAKIEELERSHDDVQNLLASTDIATIFLDRDMHIKLFNPPTARLLNLRPGDTGRPISDFAARVTSVALLADARQVLESLAPVERDVWSNGEHDEQQGRCYLRRIVPYRSGADHISGVVVTFVDITSRHHMETQLEARIEERTGELQEREQRLQAIMDAVVDAIIIFDMEGTILAINPAAGDIFGYNAEGMVNRNVSTLLSCAKGQHNSQDVARFLQNGISEMLGQRREIIGRRSDSSEMPVEVTVSRIDHHDLFVAVLRDLTETRVLEREVANASTLEQERIGREIHDGIGQQLSGLSMLAQSLKNELTGAGEAQNSKLDDLIQHLTGLIGEVRSLARGLALVPVGPSGLIEAIREFSARINDVLPVSCSFEHDDGPIDFEDASVATHMYRIVQEATNNALKHAEATEIAISLRINDFIELTIADNGKGFDTEAMRNNAGFGLRIMQYRTRVLGGNLELDSKPGQGTRIVFRLPSQALRG